MSPDATEGCWTQPAADAEDRYFFASNSAIDGCAAKSDPGYEQFEWLRIQLQFLRERGMKAIMIGHVPPARTDTKMSWEESCWQKYALWMRQYRDVIVTSVFGHMNIDHFILQDFKEIKKKVRKGVMEKEDVEAKRFTIDSEIHIAAASDYLLDLRDIWTKLPSPSDSANDTSESNSIWTSIKHALLGTKKKGKKDKGKKQFEDEIGGPWAERYSVSLVSPSVIPNYFPTLRVISYNTTGLSPHILSEPRTLSPPEALAPPSDLYALYALSDEITGREEKDFDLSAYAQRKKGRKDSEKPAVKRPKKHKFAVPRPPPKSAPPGPAYSPQPFTLTRYAQYFANLTHINNDFASSLRLEASAFDDRDAEPEPEPEVDADVEAETEAEAEDDGEVVKAGKWRKGRHGGKKPKGPKPSPRKFKYEVEYDTAADGAFALPDLTVRSYMELAARIGGAEAGKRHSSTLEYDEEREEDEDEDKEGESADEKEEDVLGKKKKGKRGKKKRRKGGHNNKTWLTFVKRAFVGSRDMDDIKREFGGERAVASSASSSEEGERMDL